MRWEVEAGTMVTTPNIGLSRTLTERYLMVTEEVSTSHHRVEIVGCREARVNSDERGNYLQVTLHDIEKYNYNYRGQQTLQQQDEHYTCDLR